ncbi:MAG: carbon-nitrogen hydrolase family protein [Epsilonproteobacteria bacterium]|nr:carbon-nitrogen hydrolase family protein [Campylobacterota bacterium]NPA56657.1 carbon-nitrogen hydrolase family protein [Campylobacterota bacterium]
MRVAALQINALGLSPNRLDYYLRHCERNGVKVLLLGEYVLNPFFGELKSIPLSMIAQQTETQSSLLQELGEKYGVTIVAPIVRVQGDGPIKSIAIAKGEGGLEYYDQQILINYPHWNEEEFYANEIAPLYPPPTFVVEGLRLGVLAGFEIHFDYFWHQFMRENTDLVLLPTVSTFESYNRWQELIKMRAFTNGCFILRANRIGEYRDNTGLVWKFYGESLLAGPDGTVIQMLGTNEEMLIADLDKNVIDLARAKWGFREALERRGMV